MYVSKVELASNVIETQIPPHPSPHSTGGFASPQGFEWPLRPGTQVPIWGRPSSPPYTHPHFPTCWAHKVHICLPTKQPRQPLSVHAHVGQLMAV